MHPGQELVIVGAAGAAGSERILADQSRREELAARLSTRYIAYFSKQLSTLPLYLPREGERFAFEHAEKNLTPELFSGLGISIAEEDMIQAGRGGVLAALWNLMNQGGFGCEFCYSEIPLLQGTVEICEQWELNPYRLDSQGCVLLALEHGYTAVEKLRAAGYVASVFGTVTKGKTRARIENGEISYLTKDQKDELEKLYGKKWGKL